MHNYYADRYASLMSIAYIIPRMQQYFGALYRILVIFLILARNSFFFHVFETIETTAKLG